MSSHSFGLIEVLLVEALVIGWAVWQWWSVRPSTREPPDEAAFSRPHEQPTEPPTKPPAA
jgi:hypothetical protein